VQPDDSVLRGQADRLHVVRDLFPGSGAKERWADEPGRGASRAEAVAVHEREVGGQGMTIGWG